MLDQNTDRMWYVIGAVLVGAAIILIANGTLPQMFASVTDSFEKVSNDTLLELKLLGLDQDELHGDDNLEDAFNTSNYMVRRGTYLNVMPDMESITGSPVLELDFTEGHDGERTGFSDFVLWFDLPFTKDIEYGDILEITYYAKSSNNIPIESRLGAKFDAFLNPEPLSGEWRKVRQLVEVEPHKTNKNYDDVKGALVMWVEDPSTVYISDMNVNIYSRH